MPVPLSLQRPPATWQAPPSPRLHAGAACVDITPGLGRSLVGHGPPAHHAQGWLGRLWANALILDDGRGQAVALVQVDLHGGSRYLSEEIARLVAAETGLSTDRIFLLASHTHRGPGYLYGSLSYDRTAGTSRTESDADWESHFDQAGSDLIAQRIAQAIRDAWRGRVPARVGVGAGLAWGWLWNRSGRGLDGLQTDEDPDDRLEGEVHEVPAMSDDQARDLARDINDGADPPEVDLLWPRGTPFEALDPQALDPQALHTLDTLLAQAAGDQAEAVRGALRAVQALCAEGGTAGVEEADLPPDLAALTAELLGLVADGAEGRDLGLVAEAEQDGSADGDDQVTLDRLLREQFNRKAGDGGLLRAFTVVAGAIGKAGRRRRHYNRRIDKWLVDARVQAIYAERLDGGGPIGLIGLLNATPTLVGGKHAVYCGDVNVMAARAVLRWWTEDPQRGPRPAVVGLGGGALGDVNVVPKGKHPKEIRRDAPDLDEAWRSALLAGDALGRALLAAADQARGRVHADARLELGFAEPEASGATVEVDGRTRRLSTVPAFGASTLRGSDLGSSPLLEVLEEGLLARKRTRWARPLSDADWQAQRPKLLLPRLEAAPVAFPLRLLRLREVGADGAVGATFAGLVALPAEISTALSWQIRGDLRKAWGSTSDVLVASPAGEFGGYAGTAWEYLSQSYEASSTLYGRWTGEWLREQVRALAAGGGTPAPAGRVRFSGRPMAHTPIVCNGDGKDALPNGSYKHGELHSRTMKGWLKRTRDDGGGFDLADHPVGQWDLVGGWRGDHDRGRWAVHQGAALALDLRRGGVWWPATVHGQPIDDLGVSTLVWRDPLDPGSPDGPGAAWVFRLAMPARPDGLGSGPVPVEDLSVRLAGFLFADGLPRRLRLNGQLERLPAVA